MCFGKKETSIVCWESKDGRILSVNSMDENHIRNTLQLIIRILGSGDNKFKTLSQERLHSIKNKLKLQENEKIPFNF